MSRDGSKFTLHSATIEISIKNLSSKIKMVAAFVLARFHLHYSWANTHKEHSNCWIWIQLIVIFIIKAN